jgi:RimJ/RimL family protein N-acetyltransferase
MMQQTGVIQSAQSIGSARITGAMKGGGSVGKVDISSATNTLSKIINKDERMLDRFQNRLIQSQYIERPKLRLIRTAQQHIQWYSDQLMLLREQMREIERVYGGDVQLRRVEEPDIRRIWRWSNQVETRVLLHRPVYSLQEWTTDIHRWLADDDTYPLSIDKSDDEHIGFLMLRRLGKPWEERVGEISFVIIDENYRELGYGTKAVKSALTWAFEEIGVDMVYLWTISDNNAAIRCFEKSGFQFTDVERDNIAYDGERYDTFRMEVKKEDWQT